MTQPQPGDILQSPESLTGTPEQWYANAEPMTVAQEGERNIGDWYIRPFHQGFLIVRGSKANSASAKAKAASSVKELQRFIDARRDAFAAGRLTEDRFNEGDVSEWDGLPFDKDIVHLTDEEAAALAQTLVMDAQSSARRLLRVVTVPPAWMEQKMLVANDEQGERQLWARRKDARWQLATPGSASTSISDEVMATREPAAFDIVERPVEAT